MKVSQYNRRNFLGSLAILSVGTAFGSTAKHLSPPNLTSDLQGDWKKFWKKSGGQVYHSLSDINSTNNNTDTKGHSYKYGEIIYLPKENILAQPTWIFWNNSSRPADVIVTFFENNNSSNHIIRLNRYEMDTLYRLCGESGSEELLSAFVNRGKRVGDSSTGIIKMKTSFKQSSRIQEISHYDGHSLILHKKFIYHV